MSDMFPRVLALGITSTSLGAGLPLQETDLDTLLEQFSQNLKVPLSLNSGTKTWIIRELPSRIQSVLDRYQTLSAPSLPGVQGIFAQQAPVENDLNSQEKMVAELAGGDFQVGENSLKMGQKEIEYRDIAQQMGCTEDEYKRMITQNLSPEEAFTIAKKMAKQLLTAALLGGVALLFNEAILQSSTPSELQDLRQYLVTQYGQSGPEEINIQKLMADFENWLLQNLAA